MTENAIKTRDVISLTIDEAATASRLSDRTLFKAIDAGDLTATRIGRSVRIRPSNLEQFLIDHDERADQ
jgi:excisionase family DNA binding protein